MRLPVLSGGKAVTIFLSHDCQSFAMSRWSLQRKYRSTFFIFPAFLPLVELLPWFLALLGAAAGGTQMISKVIWRRKILRVSVSLLSVSLLSTAGWLVWQRYAPRPSVAIGSELAAELPRLETYPPQVARALPVHLLTPLTLLWAVPVKRGNLGKPMVKDNVLYVGTIDGTLDAYATADGHPLWTLHKREAVYTPPQIAGPMIFIGEGYHTSPVCELTAADVLTGKPLWTRRYRSHLESYPAVDRLHNRLWLGGGATGLWALTADTGETLWWQALGHIDVPPLYVGERLFAIAKLQEDADGTALFELAPDTGAIQWKLPLTGNTMGSLWHAQGKIYFSTAFGQVGDMKASDAGWAHAATVDGQLLWTTQLAAMPQPEGALSRDGGLLFYSLKDGSMVALRTSDGTVMWQQKIGATIQTDIALIEDAVPALVVAVAHDGMVSIREAQTGKSRAEFRIDAGDANPVYQDGVLYITAEHHIYAYAGFGGE